MTSLSVLLSVYISILPMVFAAAINTVIVKIHALRKLKIPIDGGIILADKKRLFGDNKTWLGVAGLIILGMLFFIIWGIICSQSSFLTNNNYFYRNHQNILGFSILSGLLMGLTYALSELPNSFIKRRLDIKPGEIRMGSKGLVNIVIDHTDSILGCGLFMLFWCSLTLDEFVWLVILGALTHIVINWLLVILGVKKNI